MEVNYPTFLVRRDVFLCFTDTLIADCYEPNLVCHMGLFWALCSLASIYGTLVKSFIGLLTN